MQLQAAESEFDSKHQYTQILNIKEHKLNEGVSFCGEKLLESTR